MIFIVDQVYTFLYAILGGAVVAFLYDVLRIKRRTIKTSVIIVGLEDILYWLTAAVFLFCVVFKSNSGEMRGYIFIGNVIGVIFYESLFSKMIIDASQMVINIIYKISVFVWTIVSYPFKFIFKILTVPICFIYKQIFKLAKISFKNGKRITVNAGIITKRGMRKIPNLGKKLKRNQKDT